MLIRKRLTYFYTISQLLQFKSDKNSYTHFFVLVKAHLTAYLVNGLIVFLKMASNVAIPLSGQYEMVYN